MDPLLDAGEEGVLGRVARAALKRLPSSVYWAGLETWGIRRFQGNREQYHYAFDRLHARRHAAARRDDGDVADGHVLTWDPELPPAPADFPQRATFELARTEALYLRDRICERHHGSLLAWLASHADAAPNVSMIWQHAHLGEFRADHKELVHHGKVFGAVMEGAAILYNLELARLRKDAERETELAKELGRWLRGLADSGNALTDWRPKRFWELTMDRGHAISERARRFVEGWFELSLSLDSDKVDSSFGRLLVRERERGLKGVRSRFDNKRALEQWSGAAGMGLPSYRWPISQRFLNDLHAGLRAKEA
jgi:hypothetical protein